MKRLIRMIGKVGILTLFIGPIGFIGFIGIGCDAGDGQRCNPLAYSTSGTAGNCGSGRSCVYPTAPNCGVAYCCTTDVDGLVIDKSPSCQPDPALASVCMLDLGTGIPDAGTSD